MARGRGRTVKEPPPTFGCEHYIAQMERAVIYRSVTTNFNPDDMLDWLIPPEDRRILREALPLVQGQHPKWDVLLPCFTAGGDDSGFHLQFDTLELGSLPPKDIKDHIAFQPTFSAPDIVMALREIEEIVRRFNVVRQIVTWFNDKKVTPGAARQYFPALGSLLPSDHAFHQVDGQRFKDVYFPQDIATALRMAPEIIAKGLLCDPAANASRPGRALVTVAVNIGGIGGQSLALFTKIA